VLAAERSTDACDLRFYAFTHNSLQAAEQRRQGMEALHVESNKDRIGVLVQTYLTTSANGKSELAEVMRNLKHWKAVCRRRRVSAAAGDAADDYQEGDSDSDLSSDGEDDLDDAEGNQAASAAALSATQALEARALQRRRKRARVIFDMFDADGSASIDANEMRELMKEMCVPLTEEELQELMNVSMHIKHVQQPLR
jgi:hypothetical protein